MLDQGLGSSEAGLRLKEQLQIGLSDFQLTVDDGSDNDSCSDSVDDGDDDESYSDGADDDDAWLPKEISTTCWPFL